MNLSTLPQALRECKAIGLSPVAVAILFDIANSPRDLTTTDVCVGSTAAHTTALLQAYRLTEQGYIERHYSSEDRRLVYLRLTDKGRAVVDG